MKNRLKKVLLVVFTFCIISSQIGLSAHASSGNVKWLSEEYYRVDKFDNGIARVIKRITDYEMISLGFINTDGELIIPMKNTRIARWFTDDLVILSGANYKEALVNKVTGEVIHPLDYIYITELSEGLAAMRKDTALMYGETKWGYIDETGKIVLSMIYDRAKPFKDGKATVKKDGEWHVIDKKGNILITYPHDFDDIGEFHSGLAWVRKDNQYGYMDESGEMVVPLIYDDASDFVGDYAAVKKNYGRKGVQDSEDRCGIIDKTGEVIIPYIYRDAVVLENEEFFVKGTEYVKVDGYNKLPVAIIDKNGNEIIPFGVHDLVLNDEIEPIIINDKYGYARKYNNIVVPAIYDYASKFIDGYGYVNKDGKRAVIDKDGNIVVPFKYEHVGEFQDDIAIVTTNVDVPSNYASSHLRGLIDKTGREILAPTYVDIFDFNEGIAMVTKYQDPTDSASTVYGFIDKSGKLITPLNYDYAEDFQDGVALVEKDGKQGFIDKTGKVVVPIIYDYVRESNGGTIVVNLNNRMGIVKNPVYESLMAEIAAPTASSIVVNGNVVSFDAYNINGNNYFKLRDLAAAFNGTEKQFDISWDGNNKEINMISNKEYSFVGGELTQGNGNTTWAILSTANIKVDGKNVKLTAYTINDNNYFKLRDIGKLFNIGVDWDGQTNTIIIDTSKDYIE